jgi:hypothetical protein
MIYFLDYNINFSVRKKTGMSCRITFNFSPIAENIEKGAHSYGSCCKLQVGFLLHNTCPSEILRDANAFVHGGQSGKRLVGISRQQPNLHALLSDTAHSKDITSFAPIMLWALAYICPKFIHGLPTVQLCLVVLQEFKYHKKAGLIQ